MIAIIIKSSVLENLDLELDYSLEFIDLYVLLLRAEGLYINGVDMVLVEPRGMKHLGENLALGLVGLWGLLISLLKLQTVLFEIVSLIYIGLAKRNSRSVLPHLEMQIPCLSSQISLNPHSKPKCLNFVQHKYNYNYMSLNMHIKMSHALLHINLVWFCLIMWSLEVVPYEFNVKNYTRASAWEI